MIVTNRSAYCTQILGIPFREVLFLNCCNLRIMSVVSIVFTLHSRMHLLLRDTQVVSTYLSIYARLTYFSHSRFVWQTQSTSYRKVTGTYRLTLRCLAQATLVTYIGTTRRYYKTQWLYLLSAYYGITYITQVGIHLQLHYKGEFK